MLEQAQSLLNQYWEIETERENFYLDETADRRLRARQDEIEIAIVSLMGYRWFQTAAFELQSLVERYWGGSDVEERNRLQESIVAIMGLQWFEGISR